MIQLNFGRNWLALVTIIMLTVFVGFVAWRMPVHTTVTVNQDISIMRVLSSVNHLSIRRNISNDGWEGLNLGDYNPGRENLKWLLILRKSNRFHRSSTLTEQQADFIFNIDTYEGKPRLDGTDPSYYYNSVTGELGGDNQFCYVPDSFRVWMKKVKKSIAVVSK